MNKKMKLLLFFSILFLCVWVYASDTLIAFIWWWQQSSWLSSQGERIMTLSDNDLKLINKDNDNIVTWDYFSWYYFDPAFWVFQMDASPNTTKNVQISWVSVSSCSSWYDGYKLIGYAYSHHFWFINFNHDVNNYVYVCIPKDGNDPWLFGSLHGNAYSVNIGFQNFDDIVLDASVDLWSEHDSQWRFLKVEWNTTSQDAQESITGQLTDDLRVFWDISKSSLKTDIQKKVYKVIQNAPISNGSYIVSNLASVVWGSWDGSKLLNNSVLYFGNTQGRFVNVSWTDNLQWSKTLVVEWGDIYITGNIRWEWMLWIVSLRKWWEWGNIYIHPSVTDVHANIYADRSILSAMDANWNRRIETSEEHDGATQADILRNQLYIKWSVFSENTIGGSLTSSCPFYITSCTADISKKYDLNYFRRYILVQPYNTDGNPVWDKQPQYGGLESYLGDNSRINTENQKTWYRDYPFIIEYDARIQDTPPPLF